MWYRFMFHWYILTTGYSRLLSHVNFVVFVSVIEMESETSSDTLVDAVWDNDMPPNLHPTLTPAVADSPQVAVCDIVSVLVTLTVTDCETSMNWPEVTKFQKPPASAHPLSGILEMADAQLNVDCPDLTFITQKPSSSG